MSGIKLSQFCAALCLVKLVETGTKEVKLSYKGPSEKTDLVKEEQYQKTEMFPRVSFQVSLSWLTKEHSLFQKQRIYSVLKSLNMWIWDLKEQNCKKSVYVMNFASEPFFLTSSNQNCIGNMDAC